MFDNLPERVKVVEVGPRDGLQNEATMLATAAKIELIERLAGAGLKHIEVTSFVSPKWIPQLADGPEVASKVSLPPDVITSALVPNAKGFAAATQAGIKEISLFMSASEAHSKKNINKSVSEAIDVIKNVALLAKAERLRVRAYLSVVFACPYEGVIAPRQVLDIVNQLVAAGVDEISLGDTIGAATPKEVVALVSLLQKSIDKSKLALHFHDTRGTALVNVLAGLMAGIATYDASVGGLGGCPYAPGASGNLATEDLVYLLHSLGLQTGVDLDKLVEVGRFAEKLLGKTLPGRYLRSQTKVFASTTACAEE